MTPSSQPPAKGRAEESRLEADDLARTDPGPSKPRRWLRRAGWALAALVILVGLAGWFLLATQPGARWLFARAGAMMPGALEVERLTGPIRGPLSLDGLVWRNEGLEVRIDHLTLEWRLRALLSRRLDIQSLDAEGVLVRLAESDETEPTVLPDVHLPINIIVRQAQVRDIRVQSPGDDPPFVIGTLDLATRSRGDLVEIETFRVASPDFDLDVGGTLEPAGDYPVDLRVAWTLRPPPGEIAGPPPGETADQAASEEATLPPQPWAGSGTLTGSLERLRVEQALSAPLTARLDATLEQPLRDLAFGGSVEAEPFALRLLDPSLPISTVGGRVTGRGSIDAFTARVELAAETADHGPLRLAGGVERAGDRVRATDLILTSPGTPTRLTVSGEALLREGAEPAFDGRLAWTDLVWPLVGEPAFLSPRGSATLDGTAEDYRVALAAAFLAEGLPITPIELEGHGGTERLTLDRARAELLDGSLIARGEVAWAPRVEWSLTLVGEELDPRSLWADGEGSLTLRATTTGHLAEAGPFGEARVQSLTGTLRGAPFEALGRVELAGERVTVSDLELSWGATESGTIELAAAGRVAPTLDLTFDLDAPNLGVALAGAGGSLSAEGRLQGTTDLPRVTLTARGANLVQGDLSAATFEARADLDLAPGAALSLDAALTGVISGDTRLRRVAVVGEGTRERHRLTATVEAEADAPTTEGSLRARLEGELDAETVWRGALTALDLTLPEAGAWSLASPAPLTASAREARLGSLCAVSGEARLCVDGSWRAAGSQGAATGDASSTAGGWDAAATLTRLPLALGASFLPPDLEISGTLSGTVTARGDERGEIVAAADLKPGPGTVVYPMPDGSKETLRFALGELTAAATASGVEARFRLPLPDLGSAQGALRLPGYRIAGSSDEEPSAEDRSSAAQPIEGNLTAAIDDLSFLQAFSDQLTDTAGRLSADLQIGGTLDNPRVGGNAALTEGRASIPEFGIDLRDMRLTARGEGTADDLRGGALQLDGSLRSGNGTLTLAGTAPPVPSGDNPIRVTLRGEKFTAMRTREIELLASPDIELTFDGQRLAVTGEVRIPEATVEIKKAPVGTVTASDDVVFVGREVAPTQAALPLAMRVRVVLGSDVEIAVLGLEAKPKGSLLLVEEPGQPTYGTGEIDVAGGTFKAYGQDLTIERGRLIFSGPIDAPRIDIRAFRKARDGVIAGLEARGTLEQPEISLWSTPTMAQADQLSYLLLGRAIDQASESDGNLVANAASSLGLKGGNLLAERLGARFGLEEARVETDGGLEEASLVLGKFLTPRLYVAYGVGLFEAANTMRIRYLLSSKWTLEATTGVASGADLLYTIERGRGAKRRVPPVEEVETPRGPSGE